jgi:hypothetical protein
VVDAFHAGIFAAPVQVNDYDSNAEKTLREDPPPGTTPAWGRAGLLPEIRTRNALPHRIVRTRQIQLAPSRFLSNEQRWCVKKLASPADMSNT